MLFLASFVELLGDEGSCSEVGDRLLPDIFNNSQLRGFRVPVKQKDTLVLVRNRKVLLLHHTSVDRSDGIWCREVLGLAQLQIVEPSLRIELLAFNTLAGMVLHDFNFSRHREVQV